MAAMHDHRAHPHLPPGPGGPSALLLHRYMSDSRGLLEEAHAEFGDVFTLRLFGARPMVCFASPDAAREILRETGAKLGGGADVVQATLGADNVLLENGAIHALHRRRMMPALTGEALFAHGETMREAAEEGVDALEIGPRVRMVAWARRVTLAVMQRCLFGMSDGPEYRAIGEDVIALAEQGQKPSSFIVSALAPPELLESITRGRFAGDGTRMSDPWWVKPFLANPLVQANRRLQERILAHVRRVRRGEIEVPETSMLHALLELAKRQGKEPSDLELGNDLITLLVAGHDTTAISFAWLAELLASHPEVVAELRRELADAGGLGSLSAEHLGRLRYLDATIRESMRLTPIASGLPRTSIAPITIAGVEIPADVGVLAMGSAIQRSTAVYADPFRFDPSRMLEERSKPEHFLPFGGGYRRCLGAYFATLELKYVVSAFVERVEFGPATGHPPLRHGKTGIVTGPADEAPIHVRRVRARAMGRTNQASRPAL